MPAARSTTAVLRFAGSLRKGVVFAPLAFHRLTEFNMRIVMLPLVLSLLQPAAASVTGNRPGPRERQDIPADYRWDVSRIYPDWATWEADLGRFDQLIAGYAALEGRLAEGAAVLLETQLRGDEMGQLAYKLYRYPQLQRDTDLRDNALLGRLQQVQTVFAKWRTATSWFTPELLALPQQQVTEWIDSTPGLAPYRFPLLDLYRQQLHVLDAEQERLLSLFSKFNGSPATVFGQLSTADAVFPEVTFGNGETFTMTYAGYARALRMLRNQADRRLAFESHFQVFSANRNTYAAIYTALLERNWANAQARRYSTTLEAALDDHAIPVAVVDNLIATVRANTAPLQRYHRLRREVLGLESYHLFDGSIPLVDRVREYTYEQALPLVLESLEFYGDAYLKQARQLLEGGFTDVYESVGKRAGAYSAGVYGVGPYTLLNYNDTLDSVFTLAHELGHSMHTVLADTHQPFATASYTIFVAEVASTMNEKLLLQVLLDRARDPEERIALILHQIEGIVGTFYAQVLFADFERQAHRAIESGQPMTADTLAEIYRQLLLDYYGDAVDHDPLYELTWARIPHFYNSPYYVYQYATCYASSSVIYERLNSLPEGAQRTAAIEQYLDLLRAGGNDHPMEQLRKAGVDLAQPEAITAVAHELDRLVGLLEAEMKPRRSR